MFIDFLLGIKVAAGVALCGLSEFAMTRKKQCLGKN